MEASPPSERPQHPARPRRSRLTLALRALALLSLGLGGFFVFRYTPLAEWVEPQRLEALLAQVRGRWWTPLALLGLYALLCPLGVPAIPLLFTGGAIFGSLVGTGWNYLGTLLGASITYFVARSLGREVVERLGGERMKRAERLLHRHGFWALVSTRFLPLPFPLVNAAAAIAGVRFPFFLAAGAVGLAPSVAVWTYFSAALVGAASAAERGRLALYLTEALALLVALVMTPTAVRLWRRRRRLAVLRQRRRER